jgi:1-acyl-sn-glycerol-3-phosphate acyltransferase
VANHQSLNDIPPLIWKFRAFQPVLVSKAELASGVPSVSYNFKTGGVVAIQRKNPSQSLEAMRQLGVRIAQSGESVLYFPEGTRSRDGRLGTFKSGGLDQLLKSVPNIELIPVAVHRSWELARWNFLPLPFGVTIRFDVLPSIHASAFEGDTTLKARAMMQAARQSIHLQIQNQHGS